jgi:hypothetical protein
VSLWTPDGDIPVNRTPNQSSAGTGPAPSPELRAALAEAGINIDELTAEQQAEAAAMLMEMARVREEMLSVPATDVIANHLMGIYELGAIHLAQNPPNFNEATVAIEAFRAVLERLSTAFGENEVILRQALSQMQLTFVQLKEAAETTDPAE